MQKQPATDGILTCYAFQVSHLAFSMW